MGMCRLKKGASSTFLAVDDKVALLIARGDLVSDSVSIRILSQYRGNQRVGPSILGDKGPVAVDRETILNPRSSLFLQLENIRGTLK